MSFVSLSIVCPTIESTRIESLLAQKNKDGSSEMERKGDCRI